MAQWQLCYAIFSPKKPTEKIHLAAHNAYEDNPGKRLMSETDNSHTSRKTALGVNWLNLFYLNIQSLRRKVNDLELHLSDNPPHIVCFSEHWLTAAELLSQKRVWWCCNINKTKCCRHLSNGVQGITLDTTLCWEAHVDVLSKKLAKTIYLLPYSRAILRMLLRLGDIQHIFPEFSNFRGKQFV
ncbi:hypothetical protein Zmor_013098 [Zophobas morio]|uniref:Uncharacterized protein n=1 Tax=Zophobas morio TaxID=2755281 RepID=A0AA38ICL9_9CUCU|nr:hypothetical protein Zmor_013098 [Zophobas morio]